MCQICSGIQRHICSICVHKDVVVEGYNEGMQGRERGWGHYPTAMVASGGVLILRLSGVDAAVEPQR